MHEGKERQEKKGTFTKRGRKINLCQRTTFELAGSCHVQCLTPQLRGNAHD